MPENPLLPHRKLRELRNLMLVCRGLDKKAPASKTRAGREALLAATAVHLLDGDLLCAPAADATLQQLAPKPSAKKTKPNGSLLVLPSDHEPIGIAAAAARGLQASGTGVALAFAGAGTSLPGWQGALEWAHSAELPLILAVADATGGKAARTSRPRFDWPHMERLSRKTKLPVITVDGEDAVAIYRVMQECTVRARAGGGPAVIWAVMSAAPSARLPNAQQPIARLESYMSARKISFGG